MQVPGPSATHPASYYAATRTETREFPPLCGEARSDVCVVGAGFTGIDRRQGFWRQRLQRQRKKTGTDKPVKLLRVGTAALPQIPPQRAAGFHVHRAFHQQVGVFCRVTGKHHQMNVFCAAQRHHLPGAIGPVTFATQMIDDDQARMLQHFIEIQIDLACGNGVLGLAAARQGLARNLVFCDESAMAIASARLNTSRMFPRESNKFHFHHGDGLEHYDGATAQLILCNPPFHQEHTVNESAGRRLLDQCGRHLAPGGHLLLVANRHLDYFSLLRSTFSEVKKCAGNSKFNVLLACKD